jgi:malate dehydrogenase (oxaloacetate-decarboxylating)
MSNNKTLKISLQGDALLNCNLLNKGTAFTQEERHQLHLLGRLPLRVEEIEEQVARVYAQFQSLTSPKQQNIFLTDLYGTNQTLFFKLVAAHIEEMTPVIYTPHVATACQTFSEEFRRPYGLYISYPEKDHIAEMLDNRLTKDVDLIVVTDGERILGIGDQGVGGIGIPVGKLILYSLFGGIDPKRTLPIVLDVGTNNAQRLENPLYLGWRNPRITGKQYDEFIEAFVTAVKQKLPNVFLQWEDFGKDNAAKNLTKYRNQICSFNDDIQGTAVVTLGALLASIKTIKQKVSAQRIVMLGAGSASVGIAELICQAMMREGMSEKQAHQNFWLINATGLVTTKSHKLSPQQQPFARDDSEIISFADVVKMVKPTVLIGCSTVGGAFTKEIVCTMANHVERPIIFPLSNPTANCEALPEDLIHWTDGKALIATGSPFAPVTYKGKTFITAQCNNAFVFPGIGLGTIVAQAKQVSDEMLWAASQALLNEAPSLNDPHAPLLPAIANAPAIARKIAYAVAQQAIKEGLAGIDANADIQTLIDNHYWQPEYVRYQLAE